MSAVLERLYTVEEYLEFERDALTKHEYHHGRIYAMSGANEPHVLISGNVSRELGNHLRRDDGDRCRVYGPDMRVWCPDGLRTYPDVSVCCGEPDLFQFRGTDTLRNPGAIVEVLSKSTEAKDRGSKFDSYRTIPSLTEYLLIAYDHRRAERYVRTDAGWLHTVYRPSDGHESFPVLTAEVAFAEAYSLTRLPDEPPNPLRVVRAEDEPRLDAPPEPFEEEACT